MLLLKPGSSVCILLVSLLLGAVIPPALSQTCDPNGWCVNYKSSSSTFDGNSASADVTLVYDASEPAADGDDSKYYQVSVLDDTCTSIVTNSIIAPHDMTNGVIKKSGYSSQDSTISFGLDVAKGNNFETSDFVTKTSDDSYTVLFCLRVELFTNLNDGQGPISIAIEKTKLTLDVGKLEQGFSFAISADLPAAGSNAPAGTGVDANGNPLSGPVPTGSSFFAAIRAALNAQDKVEATYDTRTGFPMRFRIQKKNGPASALGITITTILNYIKVAGPPKFVYSQNKDKWGRQQITDYDYTFEDLGPNPNNILYPVSVKVRNSVVTEAKDKDGTVLATTTGKTFDELFTEIGSVIESATFANNYFDPNKGYPTSIYTTSTNSLIRKTITNYKDSGLNRRQLQAPVEDYSEIVTDQTLEETKLTDAENLFATAKDPHYSFQLWRQGADARRRLQTGAYPFTIQVVTPGLYSGEIVVDYPINTFLCDNSNAPLPTTTAIAPGELISVCVKADSSEVRVKNLRDVSFTNDNDSTLNIPIITGSSQEVGPQSSLTCADGVCRVEAVAFARLYEKVEANGSITAIEQTAKIKGTCILDFVTRRKLSEEEEVMMHAWGGSGRILQEDNGVGDFGVNLNLATPPERQSAAMASRLLIASTMVLLGVGFQMT